MLNIEPCVVCVCRPHPIDNSAGVGWLVGGGVGSGGGLRHRVAGLT
jgi:hypothetical protein